MALLDDASPIERQRLLSIFQVANLRQAFGDGSKEEICARESQNWNPAQRQKVEAFICQFLGCCRQHVYVFENEINAVLPPSIQAESAVQMTPTRAFYLVPAEFKVLVPSPTTPGLLAEETVTLIWPIEISLVDSSFVVQFVILEQDVAARFGDSARFWRKMLTEDDVLKEVASNLPRADLNLGIKNLWTSDFHDCFQGRYKKPYSTSLETMDENKGIKQQLPILYSEMLLCPIHSSGFVILDPTINLDKYSADPTEGKLGLPKYSAEGQSHEVIRRVIESNQ